MTVNLQLGEFITQPFEQNTERSSAARAASLFFFFFFKYFIYHFSTLAQTDKTPENLGGIPHKPAQGPDLSLLTAVSWRRF